MYPIYNVGFYLESDIGLVSFSFFRKILLCFVISYKTIPEHVPKFKLSMIQNISILTHMTLLLTARSLIPLDSLPNQTASFFCVYVHSCNITLFLPFTCGEVTIDTNPFFSRCLRQCSVLSNLFTKLRLIPEAERPESVLFFLISCQSSGNAFLLSTTYSLSTPKALIFRTTIHMFLKSIGSSSTAMRFLHLCCFTLSARFLRELFSIRLFMLLHLNDVKLLIALILSTSRVTANFCISCLCVLCDIVTWEHGIHATRQPVMLKNSRDDF